MTKQLPIFIIMITLMIISVTGVQAQNNNWSYLNAIKFPVKDSIAAKPYLITVDQNGRVYVISSKVDDSKAHNAVYYANKADTVFKLFIDYDDNGDSDTSKGNIGALRGITILGNDVIVIASQPYPKTKPNTLAALYYYPGADTSKVERFGFNIAGSGYGTFLNGIDVSKDSVVFTGVDFGTSFRLYNFGYNSKGASRGSYIPPANNGVEPGGPQTNGLDLIRDISLVPGVNYYDSSKSIFYTSRNSISSSQQTGGIAVWQNGTQILPVNFVGNRVTDFSGYLAFMNSFPYGITVDGKGILWVAGVDSTRRWVKGFKVDGVNAEALYDLPSKNSTDVADPNGAPMTGPSDVALNKEMSLAYVADRYVRAVFRFKSLTVGVNESNGRVYNFELGQNYPNPFNPSTLISYTLSKPSYVKLVVSDLLGREVTVLSEGYSGAGKHVEVFNGAHNPSGIYFYTIITPESKITKKMLMLK
jgi:hypothetical protein